MSKKHRKIIQEDVILEQRRLLKIGRSHYISVPKEFLEAHGIKDGDLLYTAANHIFQISPMTKHKIIVEEGKAKVIEGSDNSKTQPKVLEKEK